MVRSSNSRNRSALSENTHRSQNQSSRPKAHVTLTDSELASFRTRLCDGHQLGSCLDSDSCPNSHCLTWQRRSPFETPYAPKLCPEIHFVKKGSKMSLVRRCNRGRMCLYAHSKEEELYHPLMYKTKMCSAHPSCNRCHCPFAHSAQELRQPFSNPVVRALWGNYGENNSGFSFAENRSTSAAKMRDERVCESVNLPEVSWVRLDDSSVPVQDVPAVILDSTVPNGDAKLTTDASMAIPPPPLTPPPAAILGSINSATAYNSAISAAIGASRFLPYSAEPRNCVFEPSNSAAAGSATASVVALGSNMLPASATSVLYSTAVPFSSQSGTSSALKIAPFPGAVPIPPSSPTSWQTHLNSHSVKAATYLPSLVSPRDDRDHCLHSAVGQRSTLLDAISSVSRFEELRSEACTSEPEFASVEAKMNGNFVSRLNAENLAVNMAGENKSPRELNTDEGKQPARPLPSDAMESLRQNLRNANRALRPDQVNFVLELSVALAKCLTSPEKNQSERELVKKTAESEFTKESGTNRETTNRASALRGAEDLKQEGRKRSHSSPENYFKATDNTAEPYHLPCIPDREDSSSLSNECGPAIKAQCEGNAAKRDLVTKKPYPPFLSLPPKITQQTLTASLGPACRIEKDPRHCMLVQQVLTSVSASPATTRAPTPIHQFLSEEEEASPHLLNSDISHEKKVSAGTSPTNLASPATQLVAHLQDFTGPPTNIPNFRNTDRLTSADCEGQTYSELIHNASMISHNALQIVSQAGLCWSESGVQMNKFARANSGADYNRRGPSISPSTSTESGTMQDGLSRVSSPGAFTAFSPFSVTHADPGKPYGFSMTPGVIAFNSEGGTFSGDSIAYQVDHQSADFVGIRGQKMVSTMVRLPTDMHGRGTMVAPGENHAAMSFMLPSSERMLVTDPCRSYDIPIHTEQRFMLPQAMTLPFDTNSNSFLRATTGCKGVSGGVPNSTSENVDIKCSWERDTNKYLLTGAELDDYDCLWNEIRLERSQSEQE